MTFKIVVRRAAAARAARAGVLTCQARPALFLILVGVLSGATACASS